MKRILVAALLLYSIVFTTACPGGEKTVQKARSASAKLSVFGEKVIEANIGAFRAGEISLDQFRSLNNVTRKYVDGVRAFRAAVAIAEKAIAAGADAKTSLAKVQSVFLTTSNLAADLAEELKLITGSQAEIVRNIIVGIELALAAVSSFFAEANQWVPGTTFDMAIDRREVLA